MLGGFFTWLPYLVTFQLVIVERNIDHGLSRFIFLNRSPFNLSMEIWYFNENGQGWSISNTSVKINIAPPSDVGSLSSCWSVYVRSLMGSFIAFPQGGDCPAIAK